KTSTNSRAARAPSRACTSAGPLMCTGVGWFGSGSRISLTHIGLSAGFFVRARTVAVVMSVQPPARRRGDAVLAEHRGIGRRIRHLPVVGLIEGADPDLKAARVSLAGDAMPLRPPSKLGV